MRSCNALTAFVSGEGSSSPSPFSTRFEDIASPTQASTLIDPFCFFYPYNVSSPTASHFFFIVETSSFRFPLFSPGRANEPRLFNPFLPPLRNRRSAPPGFPFIKRYCPTFFPFFFPAVRNSIRRRHFFFQQNPRRLHRDGDAVHYYPGRFLTLGSV